MSKTWKPGYHVTCQDAIPRRNKQSWRYSKEVSKYFRENCNGCTQRVVRNEQLGRRRYDGGPGPVHLVRFPVLCRAVAHLKCPPQTNSRRIQISPNLVNGTNRLHHKMWRSEHVWPYHVLDSRWIYLTVRRLARCEVERTTIISTDKTSISNFLDVLSEFRTNTNFISMPKRGQLRVPRLPPPSHCTTWIEDLTSSIPMPITIWQWYLCGSFCRFECHA